MLTFDFGQVLDGYVSQCFKEPPKLPSLKKRRLLPRHYTFISAALACCIACFIIVWSSLVFSLRSSHLGCKGIVATLKHIWAPSWIGYQKIASSAKSEPPLLNFVLEKGPDVVTFDTLTSRGDVATWIYYGLLPSISQGVGFANRIIANTIRISFITSRKDVYHVNNKAESRPLLLHATATALQGVSLDNINGDDVIAFSKGDNCHQGRECNYRYLNLNGLDYGMGFNSLEAILKEPDTTGCVVEFYTANAIERNETHVALSFDLGSIPKVFGAQENQNGDSTASVVANPQGEIEALGINSLPEWFQSTACGWLSAIFVLLLFLYIGYGIYMHVTLPHLNFVLFYLLDIATRFVLMAVGTSYIVLVLYQFLYIPRITCSGYDVTSGRYNSQLVIGMDNRQLNLVALQDIGFNALAFGLSNCRLLTLLFYFFGFFGVFLLLFNTWVLLRLKQAQELVAHFGLRFAIQMVSFSLGLSFSLITLSLVNAYIVNFTRSSLESFRLNFSTLLNILAGTGSSETRGYLQHYGFMHGVTLVVIFAILIYFTCLVFANLLLTVKVPETHFKSLENDLDGPYDPKRLEACKLRWYQLVHCIYSRFKPNVLRRCVKMQDFGSLMTSLPPNSRLERHGYPIIRTICYACVLGGAVIWGILDFKHRLVRRMLVHEIKERLESATLHNLGPLAIVLPSNAKSILLDLQVKIDAGAPDFYLDINRLGPGIRALVTSLEGDPKVANDSGSEYKVSKSGDSRGVAGRLVPWPRERPFLLTFDLLEYRPIATLGDLHLECDDYRYSCSAMLDAQELLQKSIGQIPEAVKSATFAMYMLDSTNGKLYQARIQIGTRLKKSKWNIRVTRVTGLQLGNSGRKIVFYCIYGFTCACALGLIATLTLDINGYIKCYRFYIRGHLSNLDLIGMYLVNSGIVVIHSGIGIALLSLVVIYTLYAIYLQRFHWFLSHCNTLVNRVLLDDTFWRLRIAYKHVWGFVSIILVGIVAWVSASLRQQIRMVGYCIYKGWYLYVLAILWFGIVAGSLLVYLFMFATDYLDLQSHYFVSVALAILCGDGDLQPELFDAPLSTLVYGLCMFAKATISFVVSALLWNLWPKPRLENSKANLKRNELQSSITPSVLSSEQVSLIDYNTKEACTNECMRFMERFRKYNNDYSELLNQGMPSLRFTRTLRFIRDIHQDLGQELHMLEQASKNAATLHAMAQYRVRAMEERHQTNVHINVATLEAALDLSRAVIHDL
ncbi:hypothetical protein BdWA1_001689 [Babesia duncani]|uniref:Uncharacterized protein n=1 Tax=Babesia duncani TaxID=323732 RepID=A0AAD9PKE5_9APIC|nr:hypothetical protein BdWA1_003974 [Babesia duncani]KAK2196443.1 hypothetical protein BdWA1_001689 [Babesia duncani]